MYHEMRWTLEKIKKRLELIAPLVYIRGIHAGPLPLLTTWHGPSAHRHRSEKTSTTAPGR